MEIFILFSWYICISIYILLMKLNLSLIFGNSFLFILHFVNVGLLLICN